jgi:hypothetical protein
MAEPAEVLCAFCGSLMELVRKIPAAAESHALRYLSCPSCGVGEWRADDPDDSEDDHPD